MNRGNDPSSRSPRRRAKRKRGQTLVEFALVIPIVLTLIIAIAEFSFMFTAYLSISFVSRDGAQIAAELGNTQYADVVILDRIENDITAPVDKSRIEKIDIYWADTDGTVKNGAVNTWQRSGTTSQDFPSGTTITVPYTQTASNYPDSVRCNVIAAVVACAPGHTEIDTIGITITYKYAWITPFPGLIGGNSTGFTMVQTNLMRLEPVK